MEIFLSTALLIVFVVAVLIISYKEREITKLNNYYRDNLTYKQKILMSKTTVGESNLNNSPDFSYLDEDFTEEQIKQMEEDYNNKIDNYNETDIDFNHIYKNNEVVSVDNTEEESTPVLYNDKYIMVGNKFFYHENYLMEQVIEEQEEDTIKIIYNNIEVKFNKCSIQEIILGYVNLKYSLDRTISLNIKGNTNEEDYQNLMYIFQELNKINKGDL